MQRRYQRLTLRIIINYVEIMREQLDKRDFFLEGELKWEKIKTRASVLLPSSVLVSLLYTSEDVSVEDKKGQGIIHFSRCDTLLFFFLFKVRFCQRKGRRPPQQDVSLSLWIQKRVERGAMHTPR